VWRCWPYGRRNTIPQGQCQATWVTANDDTAVFPWLEIAAVTVNALDRLRPHPLIPGGFFADRQGAWEVCGRHGTPQSWAPMVVWWARRANEFAPPEALALMPEEATDDGITLLRYLWSQFRAGVSDTELIAAVQAQRTERGEQWAINVSGGLVYALGVALATCPATGATLIEATSFVRTAGAEVGLQPDVQSAVIQTIVLAHALDRDRRQQPMLRVWNRIRAGQVEVDDLLTGIRALQWFLAQEYTISPNMAVAQMDSDGGPASLVRLADIDPTPTPDYGDQSWTAAVGYRLLVAQRANDRAATDALLATVATVPQRLGLLDTLAIWTREIIDRQE
jgi:hypothetical protein